jgi:D-alanyl-lipoteichoic acid acyltransferase DltB (MBOAT superfamily)
VSGLWHGANWTFIAWGAYHALLFMPLLLLNKNRKHTDIVAQNKIFPSIKEFVAMLITFGFVVIGWIIFRADNIEQAMDYIAKMCSPEVFSLPTIRRKITFTALFWSFILVIIEWMGRKRQYALEKLPIKHRIIRVLIYFVIVAMIVIFGGDQSSFIYFQF